MMIGGSAVLDEAEIKADPAMYVGRKVRSKVRVEVKPIGCLLPGHVAEVCGYDPHVLNKKYVLRVKCKDAWYYAKAAENGWFNVAPDEVELLPD